jgi:hypothetical protein
MVLCLASFNANSQVIFQRSYLPDSAANKLEGMAMVKNYDGRYFITGNIFSLPPTLMPRNVTLHRLDSLGSMIDSRVYYSPSALSGYAYHIEKTADSNFIITSTLTFSTGQAYQYNAGCLMKIDTAGTILWNRTLYDSSFYINTRLIKTIAAGDFYYSLGYSSIDRNVIPGWENDTTYKGLITKTDKNGNLIWAKNYYNRTIRFKDFDLSPDSGLFIVADRIVFDSLGSAEGFGLFIRLDSTGNVIWAQEWDYVIDGTLNAALNDGSGFLIGALNAVSLWSDGVIIKLDYSGNFLWAKKYGIAGSDDQVKLLALLDNQKIAFSMAPLSLYTLNQFSNQTTFHGLYGLSGINAGWLNHLHPIPNDGICGTGRRGYALFVFKTDSSINTCLYSAIGQNINPSFSFNSFSINDSAFTLNYSSLNFLTSLFNTKDTLHCLTATDVIEYQTDLWFDVYPTFLVDEIIHLNLKDSQPTDLIVTLLDISGRIVYYKKIDSAYGLIQLKLTEQTSGMYLLRLETKEQSAVKKIFISKK